MLCVSTTEGHIFLTPGCKFCDAMPRTSLLQFDRPVLCNQEDSQKTKKGTQMAGLYFFPFLTCRMGPKPSALETRSDPEAALFKRLDSLQARDHVQLRPGRILVAVYGDNWYGPIAQYCHQHASTVPSCAVSILQHHVNRKMWKNNMCNLYAQSCNAPMVCQYVQVITKRNTTRRQLINHA